MPAITICNDPAFFGISPSGDAFRLQDAESFESVAKYPHTRTFSFSFTCTCNHCAVEAGLTKHTFRADTQDVQFTYICMIIAETIGKGVNGVAVQDLSYALLRNGKLQVAVNSIHN